MGWVVLGGPLFSLLMALYYAVPLAPSPLLTRSVPSPMNRYAMGGFCLYTMAGYQRYNIGCYEPEWSKHNLIVGGDMMTKPLFVFNLVEDLFSVTMKNNPTRPYSSNRGNRLANLQNKMLIRGTYNKECYPLSHPLATGPAE